MPVLVDDQIAVLANLGVLEVPEDTALPLVSVYAFQLRVAGSLAVDRPTEGVLRGYVSRFRREQMAVSDLLDPESTAVRIVNPTLYPAEIAQAKAAGCNLIAAEVVAVAREMDAEVRLAPGNARGALVDALQAAGVPYGVWVLEEEGERMRAVERPAR